VEWGSIFREFVRSLLWTAPEKMHKRLLVLVGIRSLSSNEKVFNTLGPTIQTKIKIGLHLVRAVYEGRRAVTHGVMTAQGYWFM